MNERGTSPPVACNLDSLSSSERARRLELARTIEQSATGIDEAEFGYRLRLPNDPDLCAVSRGIRLLLTVSDWRQVLPRRNGEHFVFPGC